MAFTSGKHTASGLCRSTRASELVSLLSLHLNSGSWQATVAASTRSLDNRPTQTPNVVSSEMRWGVPPLQSPDCAYFSGDGKCPSLGGDAEALGLSSGIRLRMVSVSDASDCLHHHIEIGKKR